MNEMDKQQIRADLVAHLRKGVQVDTTGTRAQAAAAQVDETDPVRVDDVSQEDETGELAGLLHQADVKENEAAVAAGRLDMSVTDVIRPGAVIEMDGHHFVVGVASSAFVSGGVEYTGISTDAPVYPTLQGRRAGDTFSFADAEHHIGAVA